MLFLRISDCRAFEAAVLFFSTNGESLYCANPDYRNQQLEFEVEDQEDADATERSVTEEWLGYCAENNLDDSYEWEILL